MINLNQKTWNTPVKIEARVQTILNPLKQYFGSKLSPENQYWTMCGQCAMYGKIYKHSEFHQVVKSGFIEPVQFHGVEINPEITLVNQGANTTANWYTGDFLQVMYNHYSEDNFRPSIVNADLINMPSRGVAYLSDIMSFLSHVPQQLLLIGNIVLRCRGSSTSTAEQIMSEFSESSQFQYAIKTANWKFFDKYYKYTYLNKYQTRTIMATVLLVKST